MAGPAEGQSPGHPRLAGAQKDVDARDKRGHDGGGRFNAINGNKRVRGEAMNEIMVGELSEFAEGGYRVLRVDSFEFGVFRQGDRLIAYENHCPHDGGPVCQGKVIPRVEEELAPDQSSRGLRFSGKRNIVCPWHGWEFDIESGRHCGDPKYRLRPVDVRVRDQRVYVSVPAEN